MTTDLERLRELVEREREAEPSPEATERGWQRLAAAVARGGTGTLSLGTSKTLQVLSAWYAGKWIVGGVLGFALAGGSWFAVAPLVTPSPPVPSVAAAAAPRQLGSVPRPSVPAPSSEPRLDEVAPRQAAVSAERGRRAGPAEGASSTFEQELRLIKAAKAEIDAGHTQAGLDLLTEHARLYPQGVFAGEREALRALGRCGAGDSAGRKSGAAFIRAYPGSPMVDRVRRACGLDQESPR